MSQEKVARYKEEKANRKEIMKKEKRRHFLRRCTVSVIAVAIIGWIGFSAYNSYETNKPRKTATVDYTEFESYLQDMSEETAE